MRQNSINAMKFYVDKCTVNINDDELKEQFKFICEVLTYILEHSIEKQEHKEVYDSIASKYKSIIRSHFLLTINDYDEFVNFTNDKLFSKDLCIEFDLPKYDSNLKYKVHKFG